MTKNENKILVDDTYYTLEELEEKGFEYCSYCDTWHNPDNAEMYYLSDEDKFICKNCYNDYDCYLCEYCNDTFMHDITQLNNGDLLCPDCCKRKCFRCKSCGDYFYLKEVYNLHGDYYCYECYENEKNILDYHEFNDWTPQHTSNEKNSTRLIWFELEVEGSSSSHERNSVAGNVKDYIPYICSHDGSLDEGFEIVSHPGTFEYWLSQKENLQSMLGYLKSEDYRSHDTDTCGLHFHVTRPHYETVSRIRIIIETFKKELITLSRRKESELKEWSSFESDKSNKKVFKSVKYFNDNDNIERYSALNLNNSDTIEFRFFKGTLNFDTFMASLELVNNIVNLADSHTNVEDILWSDIIKGEYIKTYAEIKGVSTTTTKIVNEDNDYDKYLSKCNDLLDYTKKYLESGKLIECWKKDMITLINNCDNTKEGLYHTREKFIVFDATDVYYTINCLENLNINNIHNLDTKIHSQLVNLEYRSSWSLETIKELGNLLIKIKEML